MAMATMTDISTMDLTMATTLDITMETITAITQDITMAMDTILDITTMDLITATTLDTMASYRLLASIIKSHIRLHVITQHRIKL